MIKSAVAFGLVVGLASTAAAVTVPTPLRSSSNAADFRSDQRYEFWDIDGNGQTPALGNGQQPGFLADKYNLTPVDPPGPATSNSVLPQLERAVVEFRGGSATLGDSGSRTYGVHTTNASSGQPEILGGMGVHSALTNFGSINAGTSSVSTTNQINVPWTNFQVGGGSGADLAVLPPPVVFSISRIGSALTVRVGDQTSVAQWDHIWSATSSAFTEINAIQLRMSAGGTSTWRITDLRYNGQLLDSPGSGSAGTYQADTIAGGAFTEREIFLWDKVVGDFSLTGNVFLGWQNTRPTNSTANLQFKLLDLPDRVGVEIEPLPEPASWVMLITGFGLVGTALRRRRTVQA